MSDNKENPDEKKTPVKTITIVFDVGKNEQGHPSKNMRKQVKYLKDSGKAKCVIFKEEIVFEKVKKADFVIFAGPTQKFRAVELKALSKYLEQGKHVQFMGNEGGEANLNTNFNHLLETYNMYMNNDGVIRTSYYKYLHPKEVFIQNGVIDEDFIRVANSQEKKKTTQQKNRLKFALQAEAEDDNPDTGVAGFQFVYPYGSTLEVKHPAMALLTTGPQSYPVNRPILATFATKSKGRLIAVGSWQLFSDEYFDKEENTKVLDFILNLITNNDYEGQPKQEKENEYENERTVPDIAEMSESLKSSLQDSESQPSNYLNMFDINLHKTDFNLVKDAIGLYEEMGVKHETLTLIVPQFETPMLGLIPSVFPPICVELPPPKLELFDQDTEFADSSVKLAQLTNKSKNKDLEFYIRESSAILGIRDQVNSNDPKEIISFILSQLVKYKKS